MSTTTLTPGSTTGAVRGPGVWCLAAGIIGGVQPALLLAWPDQVYAAADSSHAALAQKLCGPPVLLIGISLVVAGTMQLRQDASAFAGARWLPVAILALGIYVFLPLTPAIAGSFTAGRLGIGGWMLLFAVFGYGLTQLEEVRPSDVRRP